MPAKLAARARLLDTGHNRKTDAHDAHAVAVVAVRTRGLRVLADDDELEALRMLVDRRDELSRPGSRPSTGCTGRWRSYSGTGEAGHNHRPGQDDPRVGEAP